MQGPAASCKFQSQASRAARVVRILRRQTRYIYLMYDFVHVLCVCVCLSVCVQLGCSLAWAAVCAVALALILARLLGEAPQLQASASDFDLVK